MGYRTRVAGVLGAAWWIVGCSPAAEPVEEQELTRRASDRVSTLSQAYCSIQVSGVGQREMELDYLPHVIACENGGADLEALKAQAIAARSVAYYQMATSGSICDGQGCQVYSCNAQPSDLHRQAVAETAQQYLTYGGMLTYGFYVAGDSNVSGPSCLDVSGSTVKYVTHNSGKTGTNVQQTKLGWVGPPGFGQNRGCMSQWGARCLENGGASAADILRFYYGEDIGITTAPGSCPVPNVPGSQPPSNPPSNPPPSGTSGSCQGSCGSTEAAPGSNPACYCDAQCESYGDCCGDYTSTCGGGSQPPPPPPPSTPTGGSCSGACGSPNPAPGSDPACYCDAQCQSYGDCCGDYTSTCGGGSQPPPPPPASSGGSCVGVCGSPSPAPGSDPACYCDASCTGYGDCCADYASAC